MGSYKSSRRYGAELNEVFKATFIEGLAAARKAYRYVVARRAPARPHGILRTPIFKINSL
jgi:hypothetical protein